MYKSFFQLNRNPFDLSPDPSFYVLVEQNREILASIAHAVVRRKGFVVLTGEVGTGKTLAVRFLCELWKTQHIPFANLIAPRLSVIDFLNYITFDLGIQVQETSKGSLLRALYVFLLAQLEKGLTTVLIIDEAQQLPPQVLEEIRLLTNFETPQQKLLQVLLVGQPELDAKLDSFELRPLKQRIAIRCRLEPLAQGETRRYIQRRLMLAGANLQANPIFPDETVGAIFRYASGIPRLINSICEQALVAAYARQVRAVPVEIIDEVASYFRLEPMANFVRTRTSSSLAEHGGNSVREISRQPEHTADAPAEEALDSNSLSSQTEVPTAPPAQTTPLGKPDASFIAIGLREQEGVALVTTASTVPTVEAERHSPPTAVSNSGANFSPTRLITREPSPSTTESRGEAQAASDEAFAIARTSERAQNPVIAAGTPANESSDADRRLTTDTVLHPPDAAWWQGFRARFEPAREAGAKQDSTPGQKWRMIAAGIILLSVLAGGGFFLLRSGVTGNAAAKSAHERAAPPMATSIAEGLHQASQSTLHSARQPSAKRNSARTARETRITVTGEPAKETAHAGEQPEQFEPSAPAKRPVPIVLETLNAHPVLPRYTSPGQAPPALDTVFPSEDKALTGIISTANAGALPPPGLETDAPLPVGGRIKEPQILSRVLPVYPSLAQQTDIEGDVVFEIVVDKAGGVGDLKVISGPPVLRQAAVDALRRWKFEPSTLDGQPISVQMLVTIHFRR
jgi:general secretion pathway protein A